MTQITQIKQKRFSDLTRTLVDISSAIIYYFRDIFNRVSLDSSEGISQTRGDDVAVQWYDKPRMGIDWIREF